MTFADRLDEHIANTFQPEPIRHLCGRCGWSTEGLVTDTRPLFEQHMLDAHGVRIVRRAKESGTGVIHQAIFEKSLEENVAASRLAGGTARSRRDEWETAA